MKRFVWRHRLSWLVAVGVSGLAVLVLAKAVADAKRPTPAKAKPPANVVQVAPQNTANGWIVPVNALTLPQRDFGKYLVELPTEQLLAARTVPAPVPSVASFVNPKVEPGKVRWHETFAAACAAAKKSGKPVLLFQMMGKLDERFC